MPKHIVVTGAAGNLGSHLIPELVAEGYRVTAADLAEPRNDLPEGVEFRVANLLVIATLESLLEGADLVVHCASVHPWKDYTDTEYLDINVKGTWNLYSAASQLGIPGVVLTSSICAVTCATIPPADWPVPDDYPGVPADIYSFTKQAQETIARRFAVHGNVRTIALRPPAFMPLSPIESVHRMLGAWCPVETIVSAHMAAIRVMTGNEKPLVNLTPYEAFNIGHALPYGPGDVGELVDGQQPGLVLAKKYYPEAADWLSETGFQTAWMPGNFDVSAIRDKLGWKAPVTFMDAFRSITGN
jgi:nucleoside-diphosphate-sugar epimerase